MGEFRRLHSVLKYMFLFSLYNKCVKWQGSVLIGFATVTTPKSQWLTTVKFISHLHFTENVEQYISDFCVFFILESRLKGQPPYGHVILMAKVGTSVTLHWTKHAICPGPKTVCVKMCTTPMDR